MWRRHHAAMSIVAQIPAPVMRPAAHRVLALDAERVLRHLRDHPRDAGLWGEPAFAREVDRIRDDLAPIASRRSLLASYSREAFRAPVTDRSTTEAAMGLRVGEPPAASAARVAYAVRWLELGDGRSRPGWSELVTERA
jgi:hypothetical protein